MASPVIGEYDYLPRWVAWCLAVTLLLAGLVLAMAILSVGAWDAATPWRALVGAAIAATFAARALRAGFTLTDEWIEQRRLFSSWRLAWRDLDDVRVAAAWFLVSSPNRVHLCISPRWPHGGSASFASAMAQVGTRLVPNRATGRSPISFFAQLYWAPEPRHRLRDPRTWPANAASGAGVLVCIALAVLTGASGREASTEDRIARAAPAAAEVIDWREDADGGSAAVIVRFATVFEEIATAELTRELDDWRYREVLDIVYDPQDPSKADFADGAAWRREIEDARAWQQAADMFAVGGMLTLAGIGLVELGASVTARLRRAAPALDVQAR